MLIKINKQVYTPTQYIRPPLRNVWRRTKQWLQLAASVFFISKKIHLEGIEQVEQTS